jgi:hypothetical protein
MEIESFEGHLRPMTRGLLFLMGCRPTSVHAKPLSAAKVPRGLARVIEPAVVVGC